jgi:hypothetical protein
MKVKWPEELSKIDWSHNTAVSRSTNFTPFKLLFGDEAVTPKEIKFKSVRTMSEAVYSPTEDMLEPNRLKAIKILHAYQTKMKAWRDKNVKEKIIQVRDLTLLY